MLTGIQAQWRRRLWTPGAVARSPLSPTPCAFCSALGLGSRWRSDLSDGAPDVPHAESNTAPNTLEWLKALRRNPIPDKSLRSPNYGQIPNKNRRTRDKSRRRLRSPKNRPLLRPIMQYPTYHGKEQNLRSLHRSLTAQMMQEDYAKKRGSPMPTWAGTLWKLRRRTPERATPWKRHALKIVVPHVHLKPLTEHVDENIWDITERTTCGIELYEGIEKDGRLTLLLSGDDVAIQEATDIIKGMCERAWIFRPDPFNPDAPLLRADPDVAKKLVVESTMSSCPYNLLPTRGRTHIWGRRFEDIPYPKVWDKWSFLNYIRTLSKSKLRGHRAIELYGSVRAADEALMDLIYAAFERPVDTIALSVSALRIALECMEETGYKFLPHARRLFTLAQARRLQIDTSVFNKLLLGCVQTRDLASFNRILDFMDSYGCTPNYKTWVLFFNMMYDEGVKRQIVLAMDKIGLLHNPHATKDVVQGFAEFDTYRALDSGKGATSLCREMDLSYGPTWASRGALNKMLLVCGRFERYGVGLDLIEYFEREYQVVPNVSTFATLLIEVERTRDFDTALTALRYIEGRYHLKKTEQIYHIIHAIARRKRLMNVMAVVFAYACLEDATSFPMRFRVSRQLARPGYKMRPKFRWGRNLQPAYFSALPGYVPVELWADLYAELERDPAQEECQGAVLAALYRSQLGEFIPTVPLADMIEKALVIDERLHALEKGVSKKKGSHVVSVRAELGEEEFLHIPVHHRKGLEETKVVTVPIASEGLVNNQDEQWFKDSRSHPRMDLLPWEVMLNGEKQRGEVENVKNISEEWLAFENGVPVGKGKKAAWGEEAATDGLAVAQARADFKNGKFGWEWKTPEEYEVGRREGLLGEDGAATREEETAAAETEWPAEKSPASGEEVLEEERAPKQKVGAEKGEMGLEEGGAWQGGVSYGEETPGATSPSETVSPESMIPAVSDACEEEPISSSFEAEEPLPSSAEEEPISNSFEAEEPIPSSAEEESPHIFRSTSEKDHEVIAGSKPSAPVSTDDPSSAPAEKKEGAKEQERNDMT